MSKFTQGLIVQPVSELFRRLKRVDDIGGSEAKSWIILNEDFAYEIGDVNSGDWVSVQRGFITDFASVPSFLWAFFAPWGKHGNAAVLHDWLYWKHATNEGEISRRYADHVFLESMRAMKVNRFKARLMWGAVRLFGWWAWHNSGKKVEGDKIVDKSNLPTTF